MSETRTSPRWLPRPSTTIRIRIGAPINDHIEPLLREHHAEFPIPWRPATYSHAGAEDMEEEPAGLKEARIRIALALKDRVEELNKGKL